MGKCALILIDIQNFYFVGVNRLNNPEKAALNARKVLDHFRKKNNPVFFIKHCEDDNFLNDPSCSIHESVEPLKSEKVIRKKYPSSFLKTTLKEELDKNKVEEVVMVGMMTHMCVDTTVRACQNYAYKVTLIDDACNTKDLKYHNEVIKADVVHKVYMASLNGMFCSIKNTDEYLSEKE